MNIDNSQLTIGLNNSFLFNFLYSYKLGKNLSISVCSELNPLNAFSRRGQVFKSFGIGIEGKWNSFESLLDVEEDFSEYEFEKL